MYIIQIIVEALPKDLSFFCVTQYMDLNMSTMRPPIVLMVIHIRGLAALKMEKHKKKKKKIYIQNRQKQKMKKEVKYRTIYKDRN